ncbi:benzoate 4-monooxygenase cytochrome P450 [Aspergillus nomiae NRRL 13137]|uniref:Benzoate 4-monooxygenase cytochrome P450 n=1 Tax=Aspergillus nomiae NRRL (strain ATCC 15546 / NRRL 13137 / CBS 260.88 / M93) TaxID=1509407 RepID=A0A0L1JG01_ASPN3|nr:benzoate 4-monooxygenase cytochrome P450 [Aspergillus nomiae NRRL 13137]KNG90313.1 benzoate 4-monooxygenase cytochrome P450 [Aspergillus nomiae NRRL 13137]
MDEFTSSAGSLCLLALVVGFTIQTVYRLFFHPLCKFPGPKLAAISHLYEFYYDVICNGSYLCKLEQLHQKYGPVVRINPRELHVNDPYYYEQIYAGSSRVREKDPRFIGVFTTPLPMVATVGHEHHRLRRSLLSSYFSRRSLKKAESVIEQKVDRVLFRFRSAFESQAVMPLHRVFAALAADVVSEYCYGASQGYLEQKVFQNQMIDAVNYVMSMCHINKFFPIMPKILRCVPIGLMEKLGLQMADVIAVRNLIRRQAAKSLDKEPLLHDNDMLSKNIFDALAVADVPPQEKTLRRLEEEGAALFGAGIETTARALTVAMFHLISDETMRCKLRDELKQVMPTPTSRPTWAELEQLPYLTGVVNESLRLSHGLVARSPRIAPVESLSYGEYVIPPGTPVSQSAYFVHMNPQVFPEPESFNPERWVKAAENGQYLNRFLVSFSKGSRQCLGLNLAYAELYLTLARIVRLVDMQLVDTTINNIQVGRDLGHPAPKSGSFQVKARIMEIAGDS